MYTYNLISQYIIEIIVATANDNKSNCFDSLEHAKNIFQKEGFRVLINC